MLWNATVVEQWFLYLDEQCVWAGAHVWIRYIIDNQGLKKTVNKLYDNPLLVTGSII